MRSRIFRSVLFVTLVIVMIITALHFGKSAGVLEMGIAAGFVVALRISFSWIQRILELQEATVPETDKRAEDFLLICQVLVVVALAVRLVW